MPEKVEALGIMLVLLPGFACSYVVQMLAARRKQTELDKVVEALLFSLVLYVLTLPLFGNAFPLRWQNTHGPDLDIGQVIVDWKHLTVLAACSLLLGTLYAASINHDWLMTFFRWIRITERTARSTVWNDVFQETGGYVQIGLADGRSLMGWLRDYSDEEGDYSLFLEEASWVVKTVNGNESEIRIEGPGILLTRKMDIEFVIFLGWHKQNESWSNSSSE